MIRGHYIELVDVRVPSAYNLPELIGEVLELADRRDLGSRAARREGSTPSFPTKAQVIVYGDFVQYPLVDRQVL